MELPHCYQGKTHVPAPSGKYVVGCTDIITGPDSQNGCLFRMFYPTKLNDIYENSSRWAKYLPHEMYVEGYATAGGFKIHFVGKKIISWSFGNAYIPVVEDAEPSDEQLFPVVVFSHGLKACRTSYSAFCSDISSHGFIVAAIEHRDGSACVSYTLEKKGQSHEEVVKWIPYNPAPFEMDEMIFRHEQLQIRTRECTRTLELLSKLNEGAEIEHFLHPTMDLAKFKGLMDLSSPTIAGHSFGSTTVLRTLNADKRFKIGLAMDAWMWPLKDEPELAKSVEQPLLFINSEAFQTAANLETMKRFTVDAADHTERRVVTLKGSVHYSQNDVPSLLPWYIRRFAYNSIIDPLLALQLNHRMTLLYLRKHLGHPAAEEFSELMGQHADVIREGIP